MDCYVALKINKLEPNIFIGELYKHNDAWEKKIAECVKVKSISKTYVKNKKEYIKVNKY